MKSVTPFLIPLTMLTMLSALAAPSTQPPAAQTGELMEMLNHRVGLIAFESFAGKDRSGKDGPMAKLGLDLALIYQEHREFRSKGGVQVLGRPFKSSLNLARIRNEKIVIDVVASGHTSALVQKLATLGMQNISVYGRTVSGLMPVDTLEQVAGMAEINFARPSYAQTRTGLVTGQGDAALLSDDARAAFGVDGTGIMVGTLSDSYDCIGGAAADVSSNDLPSGVIVLADETGCVSGTDEGRAMMQIVHDIAPGASQAFHTAFDGQASFAQGIIELADAGADIINDDVIYFAEPMFQDGIIAQAVDTVKSVGVAYFSSAGNAAADSYEAVFVDSGIPGRLAGSTRHAFDADAGPDTLMSVSIPGSTRVTFVLQWDDPFFSVSGPPGADTDMDMILYGSNGQPLAGGIAVNTGGDAVEVFSFTTTPGTTRTYELAIDHNSGPFPGKVKFVFFGDMTINEYATDSSTSYGHTIAAGGQAVGAARYSHTPDFGVSPPVIEPFSSRGGTPILFDTSGNPVNLVRPKPDFVAPDGVDNTFFGFDYEGNGWPNFFGTSAAAPHAAGMAALLKDFDSTLDPDGIYTVMQNTAVDMGTVGFDFDTGHGLVQATPAFASLDLDADAIPDSLDNCLLIPNEGQEDTDDDSHGDACDNCILVANADQRDTNADGFGNVCDADLDNDNLVGFSDFSVFRSVFGSSDPDADFDGDGVVGFSDFSIFRAAFGGEPGPSALNP